MLGFPRRPPDATPSKTPDQARAKSFEVAESRAQSAVSTSQTFEKVMALMGDGWGGPRPWAQVQASLPDGRLIRVGNQLVHVEQAGHGEPVLLIHGFGCSSYSWRHLIPSLQRRFHVVAPDLNGFGWTQRPKDVAAYSLEGQEALLTGTLDALGIDRFHVIGHSYGGGLAIWLASRLPERVRSLTLLASVLPEYSVQQRQAWARFRSLNWLLVHFFVLSRGAIRKALQACYHDHSLITDEVIESYRERLLVEGVEDAYYGLMAPLELPTPNVDLATLRVPALVLWGEDDRLIPFRKAEPHLRALPVHETVVLERCGHAPMEECPQQVLRHLLPFLEAHRERWPDRLRDALRRLGGRTPGPTTPAPKAA